MLFVFSHYANALKSIKCVGRMVGDRQRGDQPLVRDPRVLRAGVSRAGARDAGHFAAGCAHGSARLRVRRARCAARQAGLHVHAHRRSSHQLRTRGTT